MTIPAPASWQCYLTKLLECRCVDLELYHSGDDCVQFDDIRTPIGVIKSHSECFENKHDLPWRYFRNYHRADVIGRLSGRARISPKKSQSILRDAAVWSAARVGVGCRPRRRATGLHIKLCEPSGAAHRWIKDIEIDMLLHVSVGSRGRKSNGRFTRGVRAAPHMLHIGPSSNHANPPPPAPAVQLKSET